MGACLSEFSPHWAAAPIRWTDEQLLALEELAGDTLLLRSPLETPGNPSALPTPAAPGGAGEARQEAGGLEEGFDVEQEAAEKQALERIMRYATHTRQGAGGGAMLLHHTPLLVVWRPLRPPLATFFCIIPLHAMPVPCPSSPLRTASPSLHLHAFMHSLAIIIPPSLPPFAPLPSYHRAAAACTASLSKLWRTTDGSARELKNMFLGSLRISRERHLQALLGAQASGALGGDEEEKGGSRAARGAVRGVLLPAADLTSVLDFERRGSAEGVGSGGAAAAAVAETEEVVRRFWIHLQNVFDYYRNDDTGVAKGGEGRGGGRAAGRPVLYHGQFSRFVRDCKLGLDTTTIDGIFVALQRQQEKRDAGSQFANAAAAITTFAGSSSNRRNLARTAL